ncbi:hypothetical protein TVAG_159890 [Trichomonas vaginalis G3]|uniref:Uncharacterized protein n=1 Tax=Trichomonas vaginalis (strain ATCC PRA-98 / G3) TaxID=412133 RepID=A2DUT1_TRIV3|nr:hypothetical protein TVAGG3_0259520 [Trichomonas vaginalis G3]EAY15816.1 hypothetical protein TVAG_159890 [Trichomonas vaginalis G3]KAI5525013.1 hypothetical protein TVAGG3_0259520 [Trichomonas vaginalis G3]|eukprot:XP_001328039.1 hypothetical protein [Trichomonas vaginalis G3]
METTALTSAMKDFLSTANTCFYELELATKDLLKNPIKLPDNTVYQVQKEEKVEMTQEQIEEEIIRIAKKSRKIPSKSFTDRVKKQCCLPEKLANETIEKLLKEGKIQEKEPKPSEKAE